eukprot:TRINITY_DN6154_c0_g1_i3.p1 TRINITY_DN6154_c0_g1~~TRINITY_DN6154_c0_g1_i3.p1  ORF type:complete len:613 (-),score=144.31 TRINITY_DN6154_c0_g1_i3:34-1872(-)
MYLWPFLQSYFSTPFQAVVSTQSTGRHIITCRLMLPGLHFNPRVLSCTSALAIPRRNFAKLKLHKFMGLRTQGLTRQEEMEIVTEMAEFRARVEGRTFDETPPPHTHNSNPTRDKRCQKKQQNNRKRQISKFYLRDFPENKKHAAAILLRINAQRAGPKFRKRDNKSKIRYRKKKTDHVNHKKRVSKNYRKLFREKTQEEISEIHQKNKIKLNNKFYKTMSKMQGTKDSPEFRKDLDLTLENMDKSTLARVKEMALAQDYLGFKFRKERVSNKKDLVKFTASDIENLDYAQLISKVHMMVQASTTNGLTETSEVIKLMYSSIDRSLNDKERKFLIYLYTAHGRALTMDNQKDLALKMLDEAENLLLRDETDYVLSFMQAEIHRQTNNFAIALRYYTHIISNVEPQEGSNLYLAALLGKSTCHHNLSEKEKAMSDVQEILFYEPNNTQAKVLLASYLVEDYDKTKSVQLQALTEELQKEVSSSQLDLNVVYTLVTIYGKQMRYKEAVDLITKAEKKFPNDYILKIRKKQFLNEIMKREGDIEVGKYLTMHTKNESEKKKANVRLQQILDNKAAELRKEKQKQEEEELERLLDQKIEQLKKKLKEQNIFVSENE